MRAIRNFFPLTSYDYDGEEIPCNLCGGAETIEISTIDRRWKRLNTVACRDCGLMRTHPMPTESELEAFYASQYRFEYQLASQRPPKFHIVRSQREAEQRAVRLDAWLKPEKSVLDLGCGTGEFLHVAKQRGCNVVGVEPGDSYANYARLKYGIDVISKPWRELVFDPGQFDVITAHHVLEHLRDPVGAIAAMERWLKPDGVIYVSVPNMLPNDKPSFERFHFAHTHGFIPTTLQAAARLHGLEPASKGRSSETTVVLCKQSLSSDRVSLPIVDRSRARALQTGFKRSSVLRYLASGDYFYAAARRFQRWARDSFAAPAAIAAPMVEALCERSAALAILKPLMIYL